jgi:hypothetical protein
MIYPFSEGFAVIQKSGAYAIIDSKGTFLVPYGTYERIDPTGFYRGLCRVTGKDYLCGAIGTTGKLIVPLNQAIINPADYDGYIQITDPVDKKQYWINASGKKIRVSDTQSRYYRNEIGPISKRIPSPPVELFGFADRAGKVLVPPKYAAVRPFSEGLAAVAKLDEYGNKKWGYISSAGLEVIPFQYSIEPGDFHSGLAFVVPADKTECTYAYINPSGNVAFKLKKPEQSNMFSRSFSNGIMDNHVGDMRDIKDFQGTHAIVDFTTDEGFCQVIDTQGNFTALKSKNPTGVQDWRISDGLLVLGTRVVDLSGKEIIPGLFSSISHFDPVSHLAAASLTSNGKTTTGYVNRDGVFVIIKASSSTW